MLKYITLFLIFGIVFLNASATSLHSLCGRGYKNATSGACSCVSGFYGANCEYKYCPLGPSWLSMPIEDNKRSMPMVACSNMGFCNVLNGICECRFGYEGRACERISCPTTVTSVTSGAIRSGVTIGSSGSSSVSADASSDLTNVGACSGHGVCRTMRELAADFDGLSLIHPPSDYTNWDADKIQGCLCDAGFEGFDCSLRSCPKGPDPTAAGTSYVRERFLLQCQASDGFFSMLVLGQYTAPIPFDADPAYIQGILEVNPFVGQVSVVMTAFESHQLPRVCGENDVVTTEIVFKNHVGSRPPIYVTRNTSETRQWRGGNEPLSLSGSQPVLRMQSLHILQCPLCVDCFGKIYFTYLDSVSVGIDVMLTGASDLISAAILGMEDLVAAGWAALDVQVSISGGTDSICSSSSSTVVEISILSNYGNLPSLGLIDGSVFSPADLSGTNISISSNKGTGQQYECSNQGICNHDTGVCECFMSMAYGDIQFRAVSSDGQAGLGDRGDCGHIVQTVSSCFIAGKDVCSGHGFCSNVTHTCQCTDGWFGIACGVRSCPTGPAFFDEPLSRSTAHQEMECSQMGVCDRTTGLCKCKVGFSGAACNIKDCVRDSGTGEPCSGHGTCLTMAMFFDQYGLSYGDASLSALVSGSTWDAHSWHECVCSANYGAGYIGDLRHPSVGPNALISGTLSNAVPLSGWTSWDCSLRNCPMGGEIDKITGFSGYLEVQRVLCKDAASEDSRHFYLSVFNQLSDPIYTHYSARQIEKAIESAAFVGGVTVYFPNAHHDNISTACSPLVNVTSGGFLVQFDSELGDIPAMHSSAANVTILEHQKGTKTSVECGGTDVGMCDRQSGKCVCNQHQYSSNHNKYPGPSGDCTFYSGVPLPTDSPTVFGYNQFDF